MLTFLHTSPVHVATFDRLLAILGPDIPVRHLVHEQLLRGARTYGMNPALIRQIEQIVDAAIADGARVVVCTCSTIGDTVERTPHDENTLVMRIDRPMAEKAVDIGGRILVVAALKSTLAPTRKLILEAAHRRGKMVSLTEIICESAWSAFECGDIHTYGTIIAEAIAEAAPNADVVVLAQASMADAAALCTDIQIPILTSPQLGVEAALTALRGLH